MISPVEVKQIASEHKFNTANIEKVLRLVDLLREIYAHPYLKSRFVLKGGTAINVFVFDIPRLSVDIDLNYIGSPEKDVMLNERSVIREHLQRIHKLQRYEFDFTENYGSDRFELWYQNINGNRDRIKLEINYLLRVPLLKPVVSRKRKLFKSIPLPKVTLLAPEELFASKIIALFARHAARDLYDVYHLSIEQNSKLNKSLLKLCTIFYGVINREDYRKMSAAIIDRVTPMDIKRTLYPLLQRELQFNLAKSQQRVKRFLNPLFRFSKKEKRFIDQFFEGKYEPELIFNFKSFSKNIVKHPMIEWKLSHITKHLRQGSEN